MIVITSEEINNLILEYLSSEGYCHSYYTFKNESKSELHSKYLTNINNNEQCNYDNKDRPTNNYIATLKDVITKGVQYLYIEHHIEKSCNNRFSISEEHNCDIKPIEIKEEKIDVKSNTVLLSYNRDAVDDIKENEEKEENITPDKNNDGESIEQHNEEENNFIKEQNEDRENNIISNKEQANIGKKIKTEVKPNNLILGASNGMVYKLDENKNTIERNIGREITSISNDDEIIGKGMMPSYQNKNLLAVGCYAGELFFLNNNLDIIKEYKYHEGPIFSIKNRDGKYACGSYDGKISIINMKNIDDIIKTKGENNKPKKDKNKKLNTVFPVHNASVYDIEWLSHNYIASCSADRTIAITNIENKKSELLKYHKNDVNCIKLYENDNKYLISCSDDGTVVATKLIYEENEKVDNSKEEENKKEIKDKKYNNSKTIIRAKKECVFNHNNKVLCLETTKDHIISGSSDNTVRLWSIEDYDNSHITYAKNKDITKDIINHRNLFYHDNSVYSVSYSNDYSLIISGSLDRTVRLWDSRYGLVGKYNARGAVYDVKSNGANKIAVAVENDNIVVLDIRMMK
ncbi:Transducin-like protein [Spraguea lophii 42_110]|uniref:Transducin-like protein n=1 Tax=Spraguea lophii (strain 42_110) TaxID=1358809 RepID=S7WAT0_SPRLO|nr:Transducin-like protein [Spraguea lophii 42_110]